MRISSKVPLPPEICLNDIDGSDSLFRNRMFYALMGVQDHPVIGLLESIMIEAAVSRTLTKASHLDRMAHYASWLGQEHVRTVDLHPDDGAIDGAPGDILVSEDTSVLKRGTPAPEENVSVSEEAPAPEEDASVPDGEGTGTVSEGHQES